VPLKEFACSWRGPAVESIGWVEGSVLKMPTSHHDVHWTARLTDGKPVFGT